MKTINSILFLSVLAFMPAVHAKEGDIKVAIELGVHSGGDEIAAAKTTDNTQTITAGNGLSAAVGGSVELRDGLVMMATFGFKHDVISGSNGHIRFNRSTIDLLLDKRISNLVWLGGGLTYHTGVELIADGVGSDYVQNDKFDSALGYLLDATFDIGEPGSFYLSLRATFIDYDSQTGINGKKSYNGNSLGLIWGCSFF